MWWKLADFLTYDATTPHLDLFGSQSAAQWDVSFWPLHSWRLSVPQCMCALFPRLWSSSTVPSILIERNTSVDLVEVVGDVAPEQQCQYHSIHSWHEFRKCESTRKALVCCCVMYTVSSDLRRLRSIQCSQDRNLSFLKLGTVPLMQTWSSEAAWRFNCSRQNKVSGGSDSHFDRAVVSVLIVAVSWATNEYDWAGSIVWFMNKWASKETLKVYALRSLRGGVGYWCPPEGAKFSCTFLLLYYL